MTLPPDGGPLTVEGVRARRTALVSAGFAFYPEVTGRKQSIKSVGTWVGKCGSFDPAQDFRNEFGSLLNDALYADELFAIDVDVDDVRWAGEIMQTMDTMLGKPLCRRHRPASPRTLSLYRAPADAAYTSARGTDGGIEIITGSDMKFGAFGLHTHKTTRIKTKMYWQGVPGNVRKADLPLITIEQRDAFLQETMEMLGDDASVSTRSPHNGLPGDLLADDVDELYNAAAFLPNGPEVDWAEWSRVGMALFAGSGGSEIGLAAFVLWTAKCPGTDVRDCQSRWEDWAKSPPVRIGAGTIFKMAQMNGYVVPPPTGPQREKWLAEQALIKRIKAWKPKI